MANLGASSWPPFPLKSERLVLRASEASDRPTLIDLFSSPDVGTYTGGGSDKSELERVMPAVPGSRPGFFVVELGGRAIGIVTLDRLDRKHRSEVWPDVGDVELGYLFLPHVWGQGFASEACATALTWFDQTHHNEPVVACAQIANPQSVRVVEKLGFTKVDQFEEFGAEQWFGVWVPKD